MDCFRFVGPHSHGSILSIIGIPPISPDAVVHAFAKQRVPMGLSLEAYCKRNRLTWESVLLPVTEYESCCILINHGGYELSANHQTLATPARATRTIEQAHYTLSRRT